MKVIIPKIIKSNIKTNKSSFIKKLQFVLFFFLCIFFHDQVRSEFFYNDRCGYFFNSFDKTKTESGIYANYATQSFTGSHLLNTFYKAYCLSGTTYVTSEGRCHKPLFTNTINTNFQQKYVNLSSDLPLWQTQENRTSALSNLYFSGNKNNISHNFQKKILPQALRSSLYIPVNFNPHKNFVERSIGNFVWEDMNGNGIQDPGEPGIPDVYVHLYSESDVLIDTRLTDDQGFYAFDFIPEGFYRLRFDIPTSYTPTYAFEGTPEVDSDIDSLGETQLFELTADFDAMDLDAGFYRCIPVGEFVWYDFNLNDIRDNFENGINGLEIRLYKHDTMVWSLFDTVVTGQKPNTPSEDGYWKLCVPPGIYYVEVDLPSAGLVRVRPNIGSDPERDSDITNYYGPFTTDSFTVVSGQMKCDIGAGFYPTAVVGNKVWLDTNRNGIQNTGEPGVPGVLAEVFEVSTDSLLGSATTDSIGEYYVSNIGRTDIFVRFTLPADLSHLLPTIPRNGSDELDSDVDNTFGLGTTRSIHIEPASENFNIDFGVFEFLLPLEWLYVRAVKESEGHTITWATQNEVNTSHFTVERKIQGESDFVELPGKIAANGIAANQQSYIYTDKGISKSGMYTYRVKQTDLDGKYKYSQEVNLLQNAEHQIDLFPNPAKNSSNLTIHLAQDARVTVMILDETGALVTKVLTSANTGKGSHQIPLGHDGLKSGIYIVHIEIDGQKTLKKLIILE